MAAVAGISSPSSMKKKFTVSAGSAGGGASLGVHSARIAGNERIAAGRLARCRSIVAANHSGGWLATRCLRGTASQNLQGKTRNVCPTHSK